MPKSILAMALCVMLFSVSATSQIIETVKPTKFDFITNYQYFIQKQKPEMPQAYRDRLVQAVWEACNGEYEVASSFACITFLESSFEIRAWKPSVRQNTDYCGAHNIVLFKQLRSMGLITGETWDKSKGWAVWKKVFREMPHLGTYIAGLWFHKGVKRQGLDNQIEIWNMGRVGVPAGMAYYEKVKILRLKYFGVETKCDIGYSL